MNDHIEVTRWCHNKQKNNREKDFRQKKTENRKKVKKEKKRKKGFLKYNFSKVPLYSFFSPFFLFVFSAKKPSSYRKAFFLFILNIIHFFFSLCVCVVWKILLLWIVVVIFIVQLPFRPSSCFHLSLLFFLDSPSETLFWKDFRKKKGFNSFENTSPWRVLDVFGDSLFVFFYFRLRCVFFFAFFCSGLFYLFLYSETSKLVN